MTEFYKSYRIIDEKPRWVIVDEIGKVINKEPNKEELRCLDKFPEKHGNSNPRRKQYSKKKVIGDMIQFYEDIGRVPMLNDFKNTPGYPSISTIQRMFGNWDNAIIEAGLWKKRYNSTHTCDRCGKSFDDIEKLGRYPLRECDEQKDWTGNWDCSACWEKYDPNSTTNIKKSVANCRTGNQNPNHPRTKGTKIQLLACKLYEWEDLDKKNNSYLSPLDCYDHKTGLYYQVRGKWYEPITGRWHSGGLDNDWYKEYESMVFFCIDKGGRMVERIYIFPWEEILRRTAISIYKNPTDHHGNPIIPWYEEYRVINEEELEIANKIWNKINNTS